MRVAIRADASRRIGLGHVMRCLALAGELRTRGAVVTLLCRSLGEGLCDLPERAGLRVVFTETTAVEEDAELPWKVDVEADLAYLREAAGGAEERWDWLVVDHYGLDARWEAASRRFCRRILVIDDRADRTHDCDLLLNQNLLPGGEERYRGLAPSGCGILIGPRYALVSREFRDLRRQAKARVEGVHRIFVCFGGGDTRNITEQFLIAAKRLGASNVRFDIVIAADHPTENRFSTLCGEVPGARLSTHFAGVSTLMAGADLAVGACGTMTWERCCLRLPALVVSIASNQVPIAQAIHEAGAAIYLGSAWNLGEEEIRNGMRALIDSPDRLLEMSRRAGEIVDGLGATRVADEMERLL